MAGAVHAQNCVAVEWNPTEGVGTGPIFMNSLCVPNRGQTIADGAGVGFLKYYSYGNSNTHGNNKTNNKTIIAVTIFELKKLKFLKIRYVNPVSYFF
jgi:hypothetical protein